MVRCKRACYSLALEEKVKMGIVKSVSIFCFEFPNYMSAFC